jgi:hypothetical protein
MWVVAALVQSGSRPEGQHQTLVTFGSTVGRLYAWGFPAYVTPELLAPLAPGGPARLDRWHNLYYPTDPIAGPAAGDLCDAYDGSPVDLTLPDPERCWTSTGMRVRPCPGALRLLGRPTRVDPGQ